MSFLLDDKRVEVHVPAATWEEAVQVAGQILADVSSVTSQYTVNMIQAVEEFGPYIVLMPKLALVHTASYDTARKVDISLVILEQPVDLGSVSGDVSVVLYLTCTDRTNHMGKLSKIADVLMQDGMVDKLEAAEHIDEITRLLRK